MTNRIALTVIAATSVLAIGAGSPLAAKRGDQTPRCHGKVATIVGTPGRDTFDSVKGEISDGDVIVARGGRDDIFASTVSDVRVCGNGGADQIVTGNQGGKGLVFDGGAGSDRIGDDTDPDFPGAQHELTLVGGRGADTLVGGSAGDLLRGGAGPDEVYGWDGGDDMFGQRGDDVLGGGQGGDSMHGNAGDDQLKGARGRDIAAGGAGHDRCRAEVNRGCEA